MKDTWKHQNSVMQVKYLDRSELSPTPLFTSRLLIVILNTLLIKQLNMKKIKEFVKSGAGIILVVCAVAFGYAYGTQTPVATADVKSTIVDMSAKAMAVRIEKLKIATVEQIRACESMSYKEKDGLVVFDPRQGGKNDDSAMSYGTLQFKKATVIYYEKMLYKKDVTPKDAILIALDDQKSGELAEKIMFETKSMASDWQNCADKNDTNRVIKLIKQLE